MVTIMVSWDIIIMRRWNIRIQLVVMSVLRYRVNQIQILRMIGDARHNVEIGESENYC